MGTFHCESGNEVIESRTVLDATEGENMIAAMVRQARTRGLSLGILGLALSVVLSPLFVQIHYIREGHVWSPLTFSYEHCHCHGGKHPLARRAVLVWLYQDRLMAGQGGYRQHHGCHVVSIPQLPSHPWFLGELIQPLWERTRALQGLTLTVIALLHLAPKLSPPSVPA